MFRALLIISCLPIALAVAARWWFGLRVLAAIGTRECRVDLTRWPQRTTAENPVIRSQQKINDLGAELREQALVAWRAIDPSLPKIRDNAKQFGLAAPPLSIMIAVFAVVLGKVSVSTALIGVAAITSFAVLLDLLSFPNELRAITFHAQTRLKQGGIPNRDEAVTVLRSAIAHAWQQALPPALRWFFR